MGKLFAFSCPGCGYAAEVSGETDCGEVLKTVTISCATCRRLRDATVSLDAWKQPPDPIPENPKCPSSRTRVHVTRVWTHPGPCPRCGATMDRGEWTVLWD